MLSLVVSALLVVSGDPISFEGPDQIDLGEKALLHVVGLPQPLSQATAQELFNHYGRSKIHYLGPKDSSYDSKAYLVLALDTPPEWQIQIIFEPRSEGVWEVVCDWNEDAAPSFANHRLTVGPSAPDPPDPIDPVDPIDPEFPSDLEKIVWHTTLDLRPEEILGAAMAYEKTAQEVAAQKSPILPEGVPRIGTPQDVQERLAENLLDAGVQGDAWKDFKTGVDAWLNAQDHVTIYDMGEGLALVADACEWVANMRTESISRDLPADVVDSRGREVPFTLALGA